MLELVPKVATLLGHMHWTLLRFGRDRLATSDCPVVPWPLADRARPRLTTTRNLNAFVAAQAEREWFYRPGAFVRPASGRSRGLASTEAR
jgi:hypothetical protein